MSIRFTEKSRLLEAKRLERRYDALQSENQSLAWKSCCRRIATCLCCALLCPCCGCIMLENKERHRRIRAIGYTHSKGLGCYEICFNALTGECCQSSDFYLSQEDLRLLKENKKKLTSLEPHLISSALSQTAFATIGGPTLPALTDHVIEYLKTPPPQTMN